MQLEKELAEKRALLEEANARVQCGDAPDDEAAREWARMERDRLRQQQQSDAVELEQTFQLPGGASRVACAAADTQDRRPHARGAAADSVSARGRDGAAGSQAIWPRGALQADRARFACILDNLHARPPCNCVTLAQVPACATSASRRPSLSSSDVWPCGVGNVSGAGHFFNRRQAPPRPHRRVLADAHTDRQRTDDLNALRKRRWGTARRPKNAVLGIIFRDFVFEFQ